MASSGRRNKARKLGRPAEPGTAVRPGQRASPRPLGFAQRVKPGRAQRQEPGRRGNLRRTARNQAGSLTVEASLALSLFVLALVSWMLIIQVLRLQSLTHHALDQAALELSEQITLRETMKGEVEKVPAFLKANSALAQRGVQEGAWMADLEEAGKDKLSNLVLQHKAEKLFQSYLSPGAHRSFDQRAQGLDMQADLETSGESLTLALHYQMNLPGMLKVFGPVEVDQTASTGIWLLEGMEDGGAGGAGHGKGKKDQTETSIWQEMPLKRGRKFLADRRSSGRGQAIVPGKGFDLYHGNTLEEAISLNLFSPSYASGQGLEAAGYQIREESLERTLTRYAKKLASDQKKHDQLETEGGKRVYTANKDLLLLVILPEEAVYFKADLQAMAQRISQQTGVRIQFAFQEKALLPEAGETDEKGDGHEPTEGA